MLFETCRMKVKVTGSKKGQSGHILSLSGPILVHFCMDFKIISPSCCPREAEVPFETFFQVGRRSRSQGSN